MVTLSAEKQEKQERGFRALEATHNSRGGVHTVEWENAGLTIAVSKLREQSNGDLRADFDVKGERIDRTAGAPVFKYFTRLNIKSAQTKASTAKDVAALAQGYIGGVDVWRYAIETACNYVRQSFNEGDAGVELVDSQASETTEWRLWPYLQERQPSIVYGPGDSGKSLGLWRSGGVPDSDRARTLGHEADAG